MHRYDIAGDKWTEVEKALPEPVSVALCFALGGKIVMFGGEVTPSERGHAGAGNFRYVHTKPRKHVLRRLTFIIGGPFQARRILIFGPRYLE